jgi:hypothetical protein
MKTYRDKVQEVANNLGITLYIREGETAFDRPPGDPVHPTVKPSTPYGTDPEKPVEGS